MLAKALGADFRRSDLKLVSGTVQGQEYFVTAYGGDLSSEKAEYITQSLLRQPGARRDIYSANEQFFREQQDACDIRGELHSRLSRLADDYRALRLTAPGSEPTKRMNDLVIRMRDLAAVLALAPNEVESLYRRSENSEGSRIAALAAIQTAPTSANLPVLLESIQSPLSPFEQSLALMTLRDAEPSLSDDQKRTASTALREALEKNTVGLKDDRLRRPLMERLMESLGPL
jgi:hypothetical protein